MRLLRRFPLGKRAGAAHHRRMNARHAILDRRIMNFRGMLAQVNNALILLVFRADRGDAFVQRQCQQRDFIELLPRKRHPRAHVRVKRGFGVHVHRREHQRAGRRDEHAAEAERVNRLLQQRQRARKIGAPNIPAIHHAERQRHVIGNGG